MTSTQLASPIADSAPPRFIGRQPILDSTLSLFGHELLFRQSAANEFSGDPEMATRSVIDDSLLLIPDDDCEMTFINCTRQALVSGVVTLLPPSNTILEILETVAPDDELMECCRALKNSGYRFAMDDFLLTETNLPFLEIADFIKLDYAASNPVTRQQTSAIGLRAGITLIAEKVETEADVELAWSEGCTLFQGYFFCRPTMVIPRVIPQNQLTYMRLLAELTREPANLREVEQLTMSEPSICYRLLRLVNSALYVLPSPVASIRSAVMMIGDDEFRKLVTVALANVASTSRSKAAIRVALERAKFCELLAPVLKDSASTLYLVGMMSLMDVILSMPMRQVLDLLPLSGKMKAALVGEPNTLKMALDLVRAREAGGWIETTSIQERLGLPGSLASRMYSDAIVWARAVANVD